MRRALAFATLVFVITAASVAAVDAGAPVPPHQCDGAIRAEIAPVTGLTPVLFVHGFLGSPRGFSKSRDDGTSMIDAVASLPGVAVYTFDYSKHASQWVTDQAIGPALARSIRCLARATGHKVVVVAHSMGGLATRVAQSLVLHGRAVSESLARVVTIGTPTRGVILLEFTNDRLSRIAVQRIVDAAGELCDKKPHKQHKRLCELLDAANAPATAAMAPGSAQLGALPPWGAGVVVHPIAADLRLRLSVFGYGTTVSLGDIVATVGSATADASAGEHPLVVHCHTELTKLVDVVDSSPCAHANEITNLRIVAAVRDQVRVAVAQAAKRSFNV